MTADQQQSIQIPEGFEAWRVSDERFARAYDRTGDRGRAFIKSAIAPLFTQAGLHTPPVTTLSVRQHTGRVRSETLVRRPWFALAVGPDVASPAMVLAALMPAVAARIPLVMAVRPRSRGSWPTALLTALELCGVEQVFAPPLKEFKSCLNDIADEHGPGGVAALGRPVFISGVRSCAPAGSFCHGLETPESVGILGAPGIDWDVEALEFSQAGTEIVRHDTAEALAAPGHGVVFSPRDRAPADARLVLEPGSEFLWDWPDMPRELFFARALVYG